MTKKSHIVIPSSTTENVLAALEELGIAARAGKTAKSSGITTIIASGNHPISALILKLSGRGVLSGLNPDDLRKAAQWSNLNLASINEIAKSNTTIPAGGGAATGNAKEPIAPANRIAALNGKATDIQQLLQGTRMAAEAAASSPRP